MYFPSNSPKIYMHLVNYLSGLGLGLGIIIHSVYLSG